MILKLVLPGILVFSLLQIGIHAFGAVFVPAPYCAPLAWDKSSDPEVIGYRVHYGVVSGYYTNSIDVGNTTVRMISGLQGGATYFFSITSYDINGKESPYSKELTFMAGTPIVKVGHAKSGQPVLIVMGLMGRAYDVQSSEDFRTWKSVGRVILDESPSAEFIPKNGLNLPRRFYRIRDTQP